MAGCDSQPTQGDAQRGTAAPIPPSRWGIFQCRQYEMADWSTSAKRHKTAVYKRLRSQSEYFHSPSSNPVKPSCTLKGLSLPSSEVFLLPSRKAPTTPRPRRSQRRGLPSSQTLRSLMCLVWLSTGLSTSGWRTLYVSACAKLVLRTKD